MHIALRKNILRDGADSFCSGEKRAHLRLHVGRKTGIRFRRDLERLHLSIGRNRDRTISCFDSVSALGQRVSDSADVFRHDTFDRHTFPADRASDEERAGLDSIGNDVVFGAMQLGHAFDDQTSRASALDLRAHLVEEIGEIDDFRFGGGAFDHRGAFGENGRHEDVIGPKHGGAELSAKIDDRAGKFRRDKGVNFVNLRDAGDPVEAAGRSPMMQPPGSETVASLQRPSSGPRTQTEARILRTTSYGATDSVFSAFTVTVPLARSTSAPRCIRICNM